MTITKLLKSACTEKEYVFETSPPLTRELVHEYNKRDEDENRQISCRDGKLVIAKKQMKDLKGMQWSQNPAHDLSELLTQAEDHLRAEAEAKHQALQSRLQDTAEFFGVPLG